MVLYLLDGKKNTKFHLPMQTEKYFLLKYKPFSNSSECIIALELVGDKWQIKSNDGVCITDNNQMMESVFLEEYKKYELRLIGLKRQIVLYPMPSKETETYNLSFDELDHISVGKDTNSNIIYNNSNINEQHCQFNLENGLWYVRSMTNTPIYVNGVAITRKLLKTGDIVFIDGIKILWMHNFIKINNPARLVTVKGLTAYQDLNVTDINSCPPVSEEEKSISLYNEDDYFYHIPRIRSVLEYEEVTIDAPPGSQVSEDLPLILTLGSSFTMAAFSLMSGYSVVYNLATGKSTWATALPSIITCVAMLFGCLLIPRLSARYQKKRAKKKEQKRQTKYKEYLATMQGEINDILRKQTQILKENSITTNECITLIETNSRSIWSREISHDDFARVRLGMGDIPANLSIKAPEKHFTLDEDNLFEMVYDVVNKSQKLENVPVSLSFTSYQILSMIGNFTYKDDYINNLVLQLASLQSALDLKIVIFTSSENESNWEYAKFLPHCWNEDKSIRFFATNIDEMKNISSYLEEEYKNRKEVLTKNEEQNDDINKDAGFKNFMPYYIIITDNYKVAKNSQIINYVSKLGTNYGFTLVTIGSEFKDLPNKCEIFVEFNEKESCIMSKDINSKTQQTFANEVIPNVDMYKLSSMLANIPIMPSEGLGVLPSSLSFLDMYKVSRIEQLNIANRWKNNIPVTSLSTPVGVHADGEEFKLDLHEKFHGPHGLIAGSTGSGKSEFIITYILSMACNYHPYEVQFVLIDYKGGGLAGAFENKETGVRIPHIAGTITNLDTVEMNRALVSIKSELKRRQKKFNEVKYQLGESTIDIYKYQKFYREGLIKEPMSHLFIISDEFAELKSQQPEFLQELVSTARIGRALGVHLILATQKPSGVVNDQIWSNSKFKVCLKVQDRSDSMEVLKRPEAASIKEAGRFYLQVGYDDYFDVGQSGWSGAKYVPTDTVIKKVDDSLTFINNTGYAIKSINENVKKVETKDLGDQLTNTVKYIYNLSQKENLVTSRLWLDPIKDTIYVNDLKKKYGYTETPYLINPLIGEYDNPSEQSQGLLTIKINGENTVIFGESGSGKENLLTTLLCSAIAEHSPEEVNFYIIDCGAEILKMFYKIPHVGEIATVDEGDKIVGILSMVSDELERRKDLFADYVGSYQNYIENSGSKLPIITVIINNYEIFSETYGKIVDYLTPLYRDGAKYGISFILTSVTTSGVRGRVIQHFGHKIALRLPDRDSYRDIVGSPRGVFPANYFGRGMVGTEMGAFEFQTAYIGNPKDINKMIQQASIKLNEIYKTKAPKIKVMPEAVTYDLVKDKVTGLDYIPIGFDTTTKDVLGYNFMNNRINIITGENISNKLPFIRALIKNLATVKGVNLKVIDLVKAIKPVPNINIIKEDFDNTLITINNELAQDSNANNVYLFLGIGEAKNILSEMGNKIINKLMSESATYKNAAFILIDNYAALKQLQLEEWYQSQVNKNNGIWLGPEVGSQMLINVTDLTIDDRKTDFPDLGFVIENSKHKMIKHMVDDMEESNDK